MAATVAMAYSLINLQNHQLPMINHCATTMYFSFILALPRRKEMGWIGLTFSYLLYGVISLEKYRV
jgi:hypothetical protein